MYKKTAGLLQALERAVNTLMASAVSRQGVGPLLAQRMLRECHDVAPWRLCAPSRCLQYPALTPPWFAELDLPWDTTRDEHDAAICAGRGARDGSEDNSEQSHPVRPASIQWCSCAAFSLAACSACSCMSACPCSWRGRYQQWQAEPRKASFERKSRLAGSTGAGQAGG